ncbi:Olfactory receptor OR11-236 [Macaca fascicularis]|uniref:Olfactory receptor OR11-236 n=1 Tax=Macaca fascicularis TaxID=9541 RepID=G7PQ18_MACFA|nr:Olfactory receptor OR11-236 [Macaca fascicularis]
MEFVFLAYPSCPELRILSFTGVSLVYGLIITGNILVVVSIHTEARLCTPMYYFLGSLSGIEICYTAVVVPHILANTLQSEKTITLLGCATQMTFFIALGSADCFVLAVMAYDRYVAICHPLQYPLLMTLTLCPLGCGISRQWSVLVLTTVMHLVCAQSHIHEQSVLVAAILAIAVPFFLITTSYTFIVAAVLKIRSAAGHHRAFSTCSSHLTVVLLQYGCCAFMYLRPSSSYHPKQDQFISLVYTLGTPLLNPLIYALRNSEMKGAIGRVLTRNCLSQNS